MQLTFSRKSKTSSKKAKKKVDSKESKKRSVSPKKKEPIKAKILEDDFFFVDTKKATVRPKISKLEVDDFVVVEPVKIEVPKTLS